jgi:hypothetical protein
MRSAEKDSKGLENSDPSAKRRKTYNPSPQQLSVQESPNTQVINSMMKSVVLKSPIPGSNDLYGAEGKNLIHALDYDEEEGAAIEGGSDDKGI